MLTEHRVVARSAPLATDGVPLLLWEQRVQDACGDFGWAPEPHVGDGIKAVVLALSLLRRGRGDGPAAATEIDVGTVYDDSANAWLIEAV